MSGRLFGVGGVCWPVDLPGRLKSRDHVNRPDLAEHLGSAGGDERAIYYKQRLAIAGVPGQCGMMFVYGLTGIEKGDLEYLDELARALDYSQIMCTVAIDIQTKAKHVLEEHGYECVNKWNNRRTNNMNGIYVRKVPYEN